MGKSTKYASKIPDDNGFIQYSDEENRIWSELYARQMEILPGRACSAYLNNLEELGLPRDRVPQLPDVSEVLRQRTGWEVAPVPALIPFTEFFNLLANKKFPAATFIRCRDEMEYLQEPDIFHEVFGHCPLLLDEGFAAFSHAYGKAGVAARKEDHAMLARLYWFTVEFGLIRRPGRELRAYGAGLCSSIGEVQYALDSNVPVRKPFDPVDALRTPYRIDIYQTVYFVIQSSDDLYRLAQLNLLDMIVEARRLGMHAPTFPPKQKAAG
ncbi:MAG: phenylalanine 4-monooxygenase [Gammaproteobacteria bacterium SG8_31]|jgi:phenylalanine-4-hydroxylase|nr:MAG: phenylalanine 4-monooxygenase [Gammaproteobacteria bacterium SG8_31]